MTTTGNILTDILIIWAPLALVLVMGLFGLLRGAQREGVVTLSIVLAALLIGVWVSNPFGIPGYWPSDLHDAFSSFGLQDIETWLGVILLFLIVLVVGYGLGSALVRRAPLTGAARIGGLLLGLVNGAALSGWLLRNYYSALQLDLSGSNGTTFNTLQSNVITYWLIVWAGWFPVVAALLAAIVALVGPFRRAQTVVATPAAQTNWQPSTAPAVTAASAMPTSYTPQYSQPYAQPQQQQYTQPYAQQYQPQFGAQPQMVVTPPVQPAAPAAAVYSPPSYNANPPSTPQPARIQDAPPTMPMPTSSPDTAYFGGSSSSSSAATSSGPLGSSGAKSGPSTGPLGETHESVQNQSSAPAWAQTPDSSWLAAPKSGGSSSPDNSAVARSEAPTLAYQVTSGGTPASSTPGTLTNCPRCGALVPGDATFCTECGARVKG